MASCRGRLRARLCRRVAPAAVAALVLATNAALVGGQDLLNDAIAFADFQLELRPYAALPSGSTNIVNMTTHAGDNRLFVTTEAGRIFTVDSGAAGVAQPELWFDVSAAVPTATGRNLVATGSQRGLQSVAMHPGFSEPSSPGYGKLYTTYLEQRPANEAAHHYLGDSFDGTGGAADSVLAEWTFDHNSGQVAAATHRELFRVKMPRLDHPIKQAAFNPHAQPGDDDYGLLYLTHGDSNVKHSPGDDPLDLGNALGKMLRVDPLEADGAPYAIPASNPFADGQTPGALGEVYAYGFRNPHTFSFNQHDSGEVYLLASDIGRNNVEEINLVLPGGNYGWTEREGTFVHDQAPDNSGGEGYVTGVSPLPANEADLGFTYPVAQYDHDAPVGSRSSGNSVASGFVIQNARDANLNNLFLFTDFSSRTSGASVRNGELFFAAFDDLLDAVTQLDPDDPSRDEPGELTQATVGKLRLTLDHDNQPGTPAQVFDGFIDLLGANRTDVRLGRGPSGELYFSSKQNGMIYLATGTTPLAGDYNADGRVDAADYTVWRASVGSSQPLPNDGGLGSPIGDDHYQLWRDAYGDSITGASPGTAVPEASAIALLLCSGCAASLRRGRQLNTNRAAAT